MFRQRIIVIGMGVVTLMLPFLPFVLSAQEEAIAQPSDQDSVISPQADNIAVTIYRDNLAFITETRTVNLPAGRSAISFAGVSDLIIPQTALLREFGAVSLEQNFDYDLLSQGALFKRSIGRKVYVTRTDPATGNAIEEAATIISAGQGVVLDINGRIETFDCSGLPEKIGFDDLPQGLRVDPTLSIAVRAQAAGPQTFTISYLASGFDWKADYILRLADEEGKADLSGWLTLTNGTAVSINNAPTAIVAGELQRLYETRAEAKFADGFFAACWPRGSTKTGTPVSRQKLAAAAPVPAMIVESRSFAAEAESDEIVVSGSRQRVRVKQATREDLGDYKLYRTPEPTTVSAYQTKQVSFLNKNNVDITRIHAFARGPWQVDRRSRREDPEQMNATLRYDIDNEKDGALGEPLPAGIVRVMSNVGGAGSFYLGEGDVRDLAVGLPVEVEIGESPSVMLETTVVSVRTQRLANRRRQYTAALRHVVRNANGYAVTVEITENKAGYSELVKVLSASARQVDGSAYPKWHLSVPAFGTVDLTYTMQWVE